MIQTIPLKYCLYVIAALDLFIGIIDFISMISFSAENQSEPKYFVIKYLLKFLLFIPIFVFAILVIRFYKLNHAKGLYGLKLASSLVFQIIHIIFYSLEKCPSNNNNDQDNIKADGKA